MDKCEACGRKSNEFIAVTEYTVNGEQWILCDVHAPKPVLASNS